MDYIDNLYGKITIPDYIGEIIQTPLLQRLKGISQGVLPRSIANWRLPSRFEHCVGTCHLMNQMLQENPHISNLSQLFLISALLHDAGNTAFSHLGETFLRKLTGQDGESFLKDTIAMHIPEGFFEKFNLTSNMIVTMVTGNLVPWSNVLHGSIDVDNLDNVGRYWHTHTRGEKPFCGERIAGAFHLQESPMATGRVEWFLDESCRSETQRWKKTRADVYGRIYGEPELNAAMMVHRALYLAFKDGKITKDFFHLSDEDAALYLMSRGNGVGYIMREVYEHKWYPCVYSHSTPGYAPEAQETKGFRDDLADSLSQRFSIPRHMVCAYSGRGNDVRRIAIPFMSSFQKVSMDEDVPYPEFRMRVYVDPDYMRCADKISYWIRQL